MDMLMGALGALFVMGLLALGFFTGWKARGRFYRPEAKPVSENELRRLQAEQTAFLQMQNYNADMAYGVKADEKYELGGSDRA